MKTKKMKAKIIRYLIRKLISKKQNGIVLFEDTIMAVKIEKMEFNISNNPQEIEGIFVMNETRTLEIIVNPYESFIML